MAPSPLKRLRVLASLLVLIALTGIFLDLYELIPVGIGEGILYPQFIPSLIQFLEAGGWLASGFALVLLLTLLWGRIFCSSLCPLGTLQDIAARLGEKLAARRPRLRYRYRPPHNSLRYLVLALTLGSLVSGSLLLVGLLDPFSLFGRFLVLLLRPLVVILNNGLTSLLELGGTYWLHPLRLWLAAWPVLIITGLSLAAILWIATRHGRLFCNTLCPLGTLLGLLARQSRYTIQIDRASCNLCTQCAAACKANCIDLRSRSIDFSRCVACFNCLPACPESGVGYRRRQKDAPCRDEPAPNPGRRRLLRFGGAGGLVAVGLVPLPPATKPLPQNQTPTRIPVIKTQRMTPPGAGSAERLQRSCTACQLCVSQCPTQVLQPAGFDGDLRHLLQPQLDFDMGYCTHECLRCTQVCPTGALQPLTVERKKRLKLGQVHFIRDNCVVVTDRTACGACAEHCPTRAVAMAPYEGELKLPQLDPDVCVGCGACEHVCPVRPHKAIYVDGESIHRLAVAPREAAPVSAPSGDFPF